MVYCFLCLLFQMFNVRLFSVAKQNTNNANRNLENIGPVIQLMSSTQLYMVLWYKRILQKYLFDILFIKRLNEISPANMGLLSFPRLCAGVKEALMQARTHKNRKVSFIYALSLNDDDNTPKDSKVAQQDSTFPSCCRDENDENDVQRSPICKLCFNLIYFISLCRTIIFIFRGPSQ